MVLVANAKFFPNLIAMHLLIGKFGNCDLTDVSFNFVGLN